MFRGRKSKGPSRQQEVTRLWGEATCSTCGCATPSAFGLRTWRTFWHRVAADSLPVVPSSPPYGGSGSCAAASPWRRCSSWAGEVAELAVGRARVYALQERRMGSDVGWRLHPHRGTGIIQLGSGGGHWQAPALHRAMRWATRGIPARSGAPPCIHPTEGKASRRVLSGPRAPGAAPKAACFLNAEGQIRGVPRLLSGTSLIIQ